MTEDSFNIITANLPSPRRPLWSIDFTRTVLNQQVKSATELLIAEGTRKVLKDLEDNLKKNRNKKGKWALCVSIILIMSLCIEEVQVALAGFSIFAKESGVNGLSAHFPITNYSEELEDVALQTFSHNFHDFFNSDKLASRKRRLNFNPIRYGDQSHVDSDFDPASEELATRLRSFITMDHSKYQSDRNARNCC